MKKTILLLSILSASILNSLAQAPELFRYQGRLVEGTNLVNATLPMSFKLFSAETEGILLYEDRSDVLIVDGLYSTYIGDHTISGSLSAAMTHAHVYLELTIDGETLSPRERLVSVPYALNGQTVPIPSGTIVLSDHYPNPELVAQGYSLMETDDWQSIPLSDLPVLPPITDYFSWNNKIGILTEGSNYNVFVSADGKDWDYAKHPIMERADWIQAIEYKDTLHLFKRFEVLTASSTEDLISWNSWTNDFGLTNAVPYMSEVVEFKEALWTVTSTNFPSTPLPQKSSDGKNWIPVSAAGAEDGATLSSMYGQKLVPSNEYLWQLEPDSSSNYVWNTTDGLNWNKATTITPTGNRQHFLGYTDDLWAFVEDDATNIACWKISNTGNNWQLISAELPFSVPGTLDDQIISHDGKLWAVGSDGDSGTIYWSEDGISWHPSLQSVYSGPSSCLMGTSNGRLWYYPAPESPAGDHDPALYFIGGPREENGLFYYRKD